MTTSHLINAIVDFQGDMGHSADLLDTEGFRLVAAVVDRVGRKGKGFVEEWQRRHRGRDWWDRPVVDKPQGTWGIAALRSWDTAGVVLHTVPLVAGGDRQGRFAVVGRSLDVVADVGLERLAEGEEVCRVGLWRQSGNVAVGVGHRGSPARRSTDSSPLAAPLFQFS